MTGRILEELRNVFPAVDAWFDAIVAENAPIAERIGIPIRIERGLSEWLNSEWFPEAPELFPMPALVHRFPRVDVTARGQ